LGEAYISRVLEQGNLLTEETLKLTAETLYSPKWRIMRRVCLLEGHRIRC